MIKGTLRKLTTRERVLQIFEQLAEVNTVLKEPFKVKSYRNAVAALQRQQKEQPQGTPLRLDDVKTLPGFGTKLVAKADEILRTGELAELNELLQRPQVAASRNLTQVFGIGPSRAIQIFESTGISTVEGLKRALEGTDGRLGTTTMTHAQLVGLQYFNELRERIPYAEMLLHESTLLSAVKEALPGHVLQICGSFRRQLPTSGDIDALLSCGDGTSQKKFRPDAAMRSLVDAISAKNYVKSTLALGPTKFMGVVQLPSAGSSLPGPALARRLDIRFVPRASFAAALLYFTGSKDFNVRMRTLAGNRGFTLNEYGLYYTDKLLPAAKPAGARKKGAAVPKKASGGSASTDYDSKAPSVQPQLDEDARVSGLWTEQDIFRAIGMDFVEPKDRV